MKGESSKPLISALLRVDDAIQVIERRSWHLSLLEQLPNDRLLTTAIL
jgi:hypothetical protein